MNYKIKYTNVFKKQVNKMVKRGKDINKLIDVIKKIKNGEKLPIKYKDHMLNDNKKYNNCHECHIEPDWLLVYKIFDDIIVVSLIETGTHSDIFKCILI